MINAEIVAIQKLQRFDAIILSPIDETNLIPGIVAANEARIPVINLGPGVDTEALADAGGHIDGKITVNFEEQGNTVATDMVSRMNDGGEVAFLSGLEGAGQSVGITTELQRYLTKRRT